MGEEAGKDVVKIRSRYECTPRGNIEAQPVRVGKDMEIASSNKSQASDLVSQCE
jgi:hypothetical protein